MKIRVRAPWAEEVLFSRVGSFPETGKARRTKKGFLLELEPGHSYLFFARKGGEARSALVSSGPSMEGAEAEVSLFPHRIRDVTVKLQGDGVSSVSTLAWIRCPAHRPGNLPDFPVPPGFLDHPFFRLGSMRGKTGALPLWKEQKTACLIYTKQGPFLRALPALPPGVTLNLSLPRLATVTVMDKENRPVPGARVLLPRKSPTRPFRLGGFRRYEAGWTDARGRVAVPQEDLEGRTVMALAWGYQPGQTESSRKGARLVLEASETPSLGLELKPAAGEIVSAWAYGLAPRDIEVSSIYQGGELRLPFSRLSRVRVHIFTSKRLFFMGRAPKKGRVRLETSKEIRLHVVPEDPGARFTLTRVGFLPSGFRPTPGFPANLLDLSGRTVSPKGTVPAHLALGMQIVLEAKDSSPLCWILKSLEEAPSEVKFRKVPGKKAVLKALTPGGKPAAGALLRYKLCGNKAFLDANLARLREGKFCLPQYGGIHLEQEGRFEIVLPPEAELLVFLRSEEDLLGMCRLRGGEEKILRLQPGAWAVVEGAGALVKARPLFFPPGAAGAARYMCVQDYLGKRTGEKEPVFMGPLFPGKYLFRTSFRTKGFTDLGPMDKKKTVLLEAGKVSHVRF